MSADAKLWYEGLLNRFVSFPGRVVRVSGILRPVTGDWLTGFLIATSPSEMVDLLRAGFRPVHFPGFRTLLLSHTTGPNKPPSPVRRCNQGPSTSNAFPPSILLIYGIHFIFECHLFPFLLFYLSPSSFSLQRRYITQQHIPSSQTKSVGNYKSICHIWRKIFPPQRHLSPWTTAVHTRASCHAHCKKKEKKHSSISP